MAHSFKTIHLRAKALVEHKNCEEAYLSLHPGASSATAKTAGASWQRDPAIQEEMKKMLDKKNIKINKEFIVMKYLEILEAHAAGKARHSDAIKALENLQKLCPEFMDRKEISRPMEEDELNRRLAQTYEKFMGVKKDGESVINGL
jgi:hypothetical protein